MASQSRLTGLVRRFLGVVRVLLLIGLIFLPIITLLLTLDEPADSGNNEVRVFAELKVNPNATDTPTALVRGWVEMRTDSPDPIAWYWFAGTSELVLFLMLYGVIQLRALFADLVEGDAFTNENTARIRKVGVAVICYYVIAPILQFIGGCVVLRDLDFGVQGIQLSPAFEFNVTGLFVGFATLVLAGILREAVVLREEQRLTI
jgi:hypothetical protein